MRRKSYERNRGFAPGFKRKPLNKKRSNIMADLVSDFVFDDLVKDVYPYLDDLRESGETNMFGAPRYVMEEFGVDKSMAYKLVQSWMENFKKDDSRN